eukprot:TRINITY_DN535_c0_g1_i2.p1 TRINITY_DN535_c0_g1~~TRINITY_DN535_c0_g1_i2.p1  ORF type:complete len:726 (+),score=330.69 TRINITY_DN535_c0_g1_i2:317-2179(+)
MAAGARTAGTMAAAGRAAGAAVRPPTVVPNAQRPGVQQQPRPQPQPAAHAARGGPVQTVPQKQPVADVTLPFNIKTRRVADLRVRHLHRRHLPDNLLRAQAHWISTEPGTMAWVKNHTKAEQITKEHVPYEAPGEGELQARCLFVTGVATGEPARHIVKRVEVVASNAAAAPGAPGPKQHLQAYGGAVTAKADAQQRKQLVELVKKQCGVELEPSKLMRFVEFEYRDGRKTVFYIPTDLGESVHLMCQCEEEEEEYEAEEEVVDEEADAKAAAEWEAKREEREAELQKKREEAEAAAALEGKEGTAEVKAPERKQVMKKVKVTKTRTKTHRKVQPMKMPLGNLLEYSVTSGMHINTVELAMAADALDEFFKREMATRMWAHLEKVGKVKSEELAAAKVKQEKIQEIKRKRQEEDEARKKRRTEKEDEKKAVWAVEDEGKTDDEKKGLAKARAKELADLWKDEDEELKAKRAEEAKEIAALGQKDVPTPAPGKKFKLVITQDDEALYAFQYFDRIRGFQPTGFISRQKAEDVLQCLDQESTPKEVSDHISAACPTAGVQIAYKPLCETRERVEIDDPVAVEKEKKEKEKAEKEKEKGEDGKEEEPAAAAEEGEPELAEEMD